MPATLTEILARRRQTVEEYRRAASLAELERRAEAHVPRGFRQALAASAKARGLAVIAEIKRASPSRGMIRGSFPVAGLAQQLEQNGAAALSVLTEEEFFLGSLADLNEASAATRLPCLRKDFIVDEFQLLEARANRADAILLIAAALSDREMLALYRRARELSLDVLCEVHDEQELERALALGCDLVGVNSRDLRTFAVDLETARRLAPKLPRHVLSVAESGIHTADDLRSLGAAGYQAFLIGESLMRAEFPGDALRELLLAAEATANVAAATEGPKGAS